MFAKESLSIGHLAPACCPPGNGSAGETPTLPYGAFLAPSLPQKNEPLTDRDAREH